MHVTQFLFNSYLWIGSWKIALFRLKCHKIYKTWVNTTVKHCCVLCLHCFYLEFFPNQTLNLTQEFHRPAAQDFKGCWNADSGPAMFL